MSVFSNGKANNNSSDYLQCPPGMWPGVLTCLIDLGTHWDSFQGQKERKVRKVLLVFEVEAEHNGKDERFFLGKDFGVGLNEDGTLKYGTKSNLRKLLEGWRGKSYGDGEPIDLEVVLGRPCQVNVIHEEVNKKTYARVEKVAPLGKGMTPLQPSHDRILYSADSKEVAPDQDWLPFIYGNKVVTVLERSLEWGGDGRRASKSGPSPNPAAGQRAPAAPPAATPAAADEMPF